VFVAAGQCLRRSCFNCLNYPSSPHNTLLRGFSTSTHTHPCTTEIGELRSIPPSSGATYLFICQQVVTTSTLFRPTSFYESDGGKLSAMYAAFHSECFHTYLLLLPFTLADGKRHSQRSMPERLNASLLAPSTGHLPPLVCSSTDLTGRDKRYIRCFCSLPTVSLCIFSRAARSHLLGHVAHRRQASGFLPRKRSTARHPPVHLERCHV